MTDPGVRTENDVVGDASSPTQDRLEVTEPTAVAPGKRRATRLGSAHAGLMVGAVVLVLLLVFILENAHSVNVGFLGMHLRLPLAVALLLAGVGGALLVGAIGAARITQLRRALGRQVRRPDHPG
jgi:uncharacterized integral membrane protein